MPRCKRGLDIAVSGVALLLLSPLLLMIAAAVVLESGWPALFSQERVGRNFRPFTLWKFRSMYPGTGPLVTASGDKRITRVGRFLRRTKLDELPQFWNVFRGDMSLVGPRPEVPRYIEFYHSRYERLLTIRPGLTDLATLEFRDEETQLGGSAHPEKTYLEEILPSKLSLSERYLAKNSVVGDLCILVRTFLVITGLRRSSRLKCRATAPSETQSSD